jgi:thioredoxin 1
MTITYPKNLTEFQSLLNSHTHVVVDFSATWCGPCKVIAPKYEELSEMNQHKQWLFCKVDVDEAEDITAFYGISAMPTFIFIKNNAVADKFAGANLALLTSKLSSLV